jgi:zinc protease
MIRAVLSALMAVVALVVTAPAQAAIEIQEVTSPGGFKAWLVEEHSIPFVAIELRFRGGASLDAPGKRGAINLMTGLLEEGAGEMDSQAFAAAREALAARISYDVGDDALAISARFLTENRAQGVELLRASLVEPRFDEDAIERVRAQVISIIRSDAKDPEAIAHDTFARLAFGDHPYGSNPNGTEESVAALTRDDIIDAWRRVIAKDRVHVAAVGDITAEELAAIMDRLLGDLPETGAPMPGPAPWLLKGGLTVVPFETPQSVAVFGQPGIERFDPDFFAAYVLNHILGGGGFSSRLMTEVREKRGLTYGIYTWLADKDHADLVMGQFASANDRIAAAIEVVKDEWRRIHEEGVTEEELADAKTYLTGAYPLRFDGNGRIASILVGMQMVGLPIDYVKTRNAKIEAVTLEDVARVAKRLLDPGTLHFVVVGQPAGLEASN